MPNSCILSQGVQQGVQETVYLWCVFFLLSIATNAITHPNAEYCSFTSAQAKKLQRLTTAGDVNATYGGVAEGSRHGVAVVKGRTHVVTAGNHFPSWGLDWSRVWDVRVGTGRGGAGGPSCGAGVGSLGAAGSAGCGDAAAVGHPPYVVYVASTLAVLLSARRLRCCTLVRSLRTPSLTSAGLLPRQRAEGRANWGTSGWEPCLPPTWSSAAASVLRTCTHGPFPTPLAASPECPSVWTAHMPVNSNSC